MFNELIVGTLLPILIAVFIQPGWSARLQSFVALVLCGVAATLLHIHETGCNTLECLRGEGWLQTFLLVLITTIATYKGVWKPTGIAPMVERVTGLPDESSGQTMAEIGVVLAVLIIAVAAGLTFAR